MYYKVILEKLKSKNIETKYTSWMFAVHKYKKYIPYTEVL